MLKNKYGYTSIKLKDSDWGIPTLLISPIPMPEGVFAKTLLRFEEFHKNDKHQGYADYYSKLDPFKKILFAAFHWAYCLEKPKEPEIFSKRKATTDELVTCYPNGSLRIELSEDIFDLKKFHKAETPQMPQSNLMKYCKGAFLSMAREYFMNEVSRDWGTIRRMTLIEKVLWHTYYYAYKQGRNDEKEQRESTQEDRSVEFLRGYLRSLPKEKCYQVPDNIMKNFGPIPEKSRGCTKDKTFIEKLDFYMSIRKMEKEDRDFFKEQFDDLTTIEKSEYYYFMSLGS